MVYKMNFFNLWIKFFVVVLSIGLLFFPFTEAKWIEEFDKREYWSNGNLKRWREISSNLQYSLWQMRDNYYYSDGSFWKNGDYDFCYSITYNLNSFVINDTDNPRLQVRLSNGGTYYRVNCDDFSTIGYLASLVWVPQGSGWYYRRLEGMVNDSEALEEFLKYKEGFVNLHPSWTTPSLLTEDDVIWYCDGVPCDE